MKANLSFTFNDKTAALNAAEIINMALERVFCKSEFVASTKISDTNNLSVISQGELSPKDEDIDETVFVTLTEILTCRLPEETFTGCFSIPKRGKGSLVIYIRAANGKFAIVSDELDPENDHVIVGFTGDKHNLKDVDWAPFGYDDMLEFSIDYHLLFKNDNVEFNEDGFDKYLISKPELLANYEYVSDEDDENDEDEYDDISDEEYDAKVRAFFADINAAESKIEDKEEGNE